MKRFFLGILSAGTIALFATGSFWMWQMGCLARESAETVRVTRQQLESVAATINDASAALRIFANSLGRIPAEAPEAQTAEASARIEGFLSQLQKSDLKWASTEGEKPLIVLYALVAAKYEMVKSSVRTPEDFLGKVANADLFGKPFIVQSPDGSKRPLADWLRAQPDPVNP